ncbi:ATP-dependent kinase-like protein notR' [Psilocybe cubensis]|uniref:P-loop containing nucleoside triphosphate hydrolase protein n=2 Tax=Psilocybe cubensis TaxID=181762 RepID=A0A8H8CR83_PSICU|nr:ATP-dependent kinase-like protein notR' [Psilocybe cubensis]KAH9487306.1 ATP-dependent kinase-like protein notR' [Psilocybe cubensis]
MEEDVEELARYLLHKLDCTPAAQRLIVGIAGIPASGKSTFSHLLVERVNSLLRERWVTNSTTSGETPANIQNASGDIGFPEHEQAILVGLDGWHLSRAQLDLLPDPRTAHDRRGIHWTFDGAAYITFLKKVRDTSFAGVITAPSFDHALKDPTLDAVSIHPYHRIVIIEGLYVFLSIPPWSEGGLLLDERWFIEVDKAEARRRLAVRHVLTGITENTIEAEKRADLNDLPNGEFIVSNLLKPTRVIQSKPISTSVR